MADEIVQQPAPKKPRKASAPRKTAAKAAGAATASRAASKPAAAKASPARRGRPPKAAAATTSSRTDAWREQASTFADQAVNTAKSAANTAKNSTGSALHSLSKLIADTAGTVDSRMGPQYGDYARMAAESVASAAKTLDEKDVNQLTEDARDFVRKSPAVAIGAAAVVGFVLMRLARGGSSNDA